MDNEIAIEGYEWRIKELKAMGITERMLRSEWCLDCQNVKMLSQCPNGCTGLQPHGYVRDETVRWQ